MTDTQNDTSELREQVEKLGNRLADARDTQSLKNWDASINDLLALVQAAERRGRGQAWGFTYGYLHGWHKSVCHEWEEEYKEWEAELQATKPEKEG